MDAAGTLLVIAMVTRETTDVQYPLVVFENELICFNSIAYIAYVFLLVLIQISRVCFPVSCVFSLNAW